MIFKLIKNHLSNSNWLAVFQGINQLRSLNKSFPNEIFSIFEGFGYEILANLKSLKSSILKNILAFVYEVMIQSKEIHPQIFEKLLPELIKLTIHTSKSIRLCSRSCINLINQMHVNSSTLKMFAMSSMMNSRKEFVKNSFKFLMRAVYSIKEKISSVDEGIIRVIFSSISFQLNDPKRTNLNPAKKLCRYFFELMGNNHFQKYIQSLVDENVIHLVCADQLMRVSLFEEESKLTKTRMNFKVFKEDNKNFISKQRIRNQSYGIDAQLQLKNKIYKI